MADTKEQRERAVAALLEEERQRRPVDEHRLAELEVAAQRATSRREAAEAAEAAEPIFRGVHGVGAARDAELSAHSALASARAEFEKAARLRAEAGTAETIAANRAMADASQAAAKSSSDAARWAKVAAVWTAIAAVASLVSALISAWPRKG